MLALPDAGDGIGSGLVDTVVEPVCVEQMGAASPVDPGLPGGIVLRKVVCRHINGDSQRHIPVILLFEGIPVVFRMAHEEHLGGVGILHRIDPRLRGGCQDFKPGNRLNVLPQHGGIPGMGHPELIVKAPEEDVIGVLHPVLEYPEELFIQQVLLNAVVVV